MQHKGLSLCESHRCCGNSMISLLGCIGVPLPTSMGVRSCCSARMVGGGHPTAPAISPNEHVCVGGGGEV